jgi:nitroreductase
MNKPDLAHSGKILLQALQSRHSVRAYVPNLLDAATVQALLDSAVLAPTAMHEEPWAFVVVQNKQLLKQLSDQAKPLFVEEVRHRNAQGASHSFEHFIRPDFDVFHGAGTLVIICAKPVSHFVTADCWMAAENLMLTASAMGLGTCVIGSAVAALNVRKVKVELGIPEEYNVIAPIVVGLPAGDTPPSPHKAPVVLAWKQ